MTWKKVTAISPSRLLAPRLTYVTASRRSANGTAYLLYADGDHILVVKYPYGRGEVLWWGAETPLTNAGLKEPGNLEFLPASGEIQKRHSLGRIYSRLSSDPGGSIVHSPAKWLALQLVLLALAVVVTFSRRSGPVFIPVTDFGLSPLEFVQTLGGLYQRAATASVAVDICYQRFRYWLTRRLGVANNISVPICTPRCASAGPSTTITLGLFCGAASRPRTILFCMLRGVAPGAGTR